MNLILKTIREHGGGQIEKRQQEQNKPSAAPEIFIGIEDARKRKQPARYMGSLSNSAKKNTKDEHFLCTAKQKSYNLLKSKIVNSLSSAIKNDALI